MPDLRDHLQLSLGAGYSVDRELAIGGMSRVFVAEDVRLGRRVVVKSLSPDLAGGISVDRFRREVQTAAQLQHPCIVPVLDAGEADGIPYYTMPLVEGETLRDRLTREGALDAPDVVRIMRDLLNALSYAHTRGIVHRDVKPENILLSHGHALLTDFGIARALDGSRIGPRTSGEARTASQLTAVGTSLGTPAYMSPEQALGDPSLDARADLYSLGVVAYEMLAGHVPFTYPTPRQLLAAHAMETPDALSHHAPQAPSGLTGLVMQLLAKDPAHRPSSADEVLGAIDRSLTPSGGMPLVGVRLTPPGAGQKPRQSAPRWLDWAVHWRWQRVPRHVAAFTAAVIGVAALAFVFTRDSRPDSVAAVRPTLVVLPFENLGAPDDQYFADGLTDEVTSRLSSFGSMQVIGRATAYHYRGTKKSLAELARELGVTHVLSGSVRWSRLPGGASRIRVTPELVRVSDSFQIWSQAYDANPSDIFSVQTEIAQSAASATDVVLQSADSASSSRLPTRNLKAYDHYLRGKYLAATLEAPKLRASIAEFEQAIAIDTAFASAWAAMAWSWTSLADGWVAPRDAYPRAKAAAQRAIALDSTLADGYAQLGIVQLFYDWDAKSSRSSVDRAASLDATSPEILKARGIYYIHAGNDSAVALLERAHAADPLNSGISFWLVMANVLRGPDSVAMRVAEQVVARSPEDVSLQLPLAIAAAQAGHWDRVLAAARQVKGAGSIADAFRGLAHARLGARDSAIAIARQLEARAKREYVNGDYVALVYVGLGDRDNAFRWLDVAVQQRTADMIALPHFPFWTAGLRGDPRYAEIGRKVGTW